jgi:hypothetical protein
VLAVPITFPSQAGKIVTTKTLKNIMFWIIAAFVSREEKAVGVHHRVCMM